MDERVAAGQDLLNVINGDKNFLDKVITGDELVFRVRSRNKASELRMGWRTFSTTEETALPKIKSEDDADSVSFSQPRHCAQRARARRLHC